MDDWSDVKSNIKKNKNKEEEYYLSTILNNGGCIRCINKSCTNNETHGTFFPEKLSVFVQNPTYINGMEASIKNAKIDFEGKKIFYTVCNYVNKRCKNCEEGRIKYIDHNNQKIALCYPLIQSIRFKVTLGLHIDIKLILKGTKFEVSAIPAIVSHPIIEKEMEIECQEVWPSLSDNIIEPSNEKIKDVPKEYFTYLSKDSFKESIIQTPKDNIEVQLEESSQETLKEPSKDVPKEYFKYLTKNNVKNVLKEPSSNESTLKESPLKELSLKELSLKESSLKESSLKESSLKESFLQEIAVKDSLIEQYTKDLVDLRYENKFLREETIKITQENKLLIIENKKINSIIKNKDKIYEMMNNIENLDTVRQQFIQTNYEQYLLI